MKGIQSFLEQIENSGIEIKKPTHLGDDYFKKAIKDPYLNKNIESRFDGKSVMAAFDLYNPSKLPHLPKNPSPEDIEIFLEYPYAKKCACNMHVTTNYICYGQHACNTPVT